MQKSKNKTGKTGKFNYKKILIYAIILLTTALALIYFFVPMGKYVMVQGVYQVKIILFQKPIKDLLKDPNLDPETAEKLKLVGEVREFGRKLGLNDTKSYSAVFDNGRRPIVWAVSASPKDRLEPVIWKFPIVGEVPYLGYFSREDAVRQADKLKKAGCDVLVRPVYAYSTLGIFPDPLFTSMLQGSEEYLANTVLHEMTHSTVYWKGNTPLNESLATFAGNAGSVEFLKAKYGADSPQVKLSSGLDADDRMFSGFMADLYDDLNGFYQRPITAEEKIRGREEIFNKARYDFETVIKPRLKTSSYFYFSNVSLDNAYILSNRRYHHKVGLFEKLSDAKGGKLQDTISFVKSIKNAEDPQSLIEAEIKRKRIDE